MSWTPEQGERRRHTRFPTVTTSVVVRAGKKSALVKCVNLSQWGICLDQVKLGLSIRQAVELCIILALPNGVTKIHWRHATVVWVTSGRTGLSHDTVPQHVPSVTYPPKG